MSERPLPPGSTLGIVGGGQLGRMLAAAARQLGYRVHVLAPEAGSPAGQLADVEHVADFDDVEAAERFARDVDVITFEFENIPSETLSAVAAERPVRPSPRVLDICRHRLREKEFLVDSGLPLAPFAPVRGAVEIEEALAELGRPAVLKTATFGYDGKGQVLLDDDADPEAAWASLGQPLGVVEGFIRFERELSVVVARALDGEVRTYPPFENAHHRHILDVTVCPAAVADDVAQAAEGLARRVAEALDLVGVLCVELFLLDDGELLVNELAPRPHNSGHLTIEAAVCSQFEQQLRAVCGLPLGSPRLVQSAAMANLLGDLWQAGEPPFVELLGFDDLKLHLYGKGAARPGRKMGHLVALGDDAAAARERVLAGRAVLERAADTETE